jgi:hypothetical protein
MKAKGTLSAKTIIKRWLEAEAKEENPLTGGLEKLSQLDLITLAQVVKAKKGDTAAYNSLMDRLEGKPKQTVDNIGDNKIIVRVVRGKENI